MKESFPDITLYSTENPMKFIEQDKGSEKLSSFFWWGYLRRVISLITYFVITLITVYLLSL